MPSPFPGMDPYLEEPLWPDVHQELASAVRRQLVPRLGLAYAAVLASRTVFDDDPEAKIGVMYPEVAVLPKRGPSGAPDGGPASSGRQEPAGITPATLTLTSLPSVKVRLVRIEIRFLATNRLVTAVEILSPVNKRGLGLWGHARGSGTAFARSASTFWRSTSCGGETGAAGAGPTSGRCPCAIPCQSIPVPFRKEDDAVPLALGTALAAAYDDAATPARSTTPPRRRRRTSRRKTRPGCGRSSGVREADGPDEGRCGQARV